MTFCFFFSSFNILSRSSSYNFDEYIILVVTNLKEEKRRRRRRKKIKRKFNVQILSSLSAKDVYIYIYMLCWWCEQRIRTVIHWSNEEKKRRRKKRRRHTHITIKKELYIYALTNLPEEHINYGGESSIFYFSSLPYSLSHFFFCRECYY